MGLFPPENIKVISVYFNWISNSIYSEVRVPQTQINRWGGVYL